jgi:geranylgeranyl reductase family protein
VTIERPASGQPGESVEVLIVGAGPAGSTAAAWAARGGRDVLLVDRATFPRDKTCGDGLTPRAVAELDLLGLGSWVRSLHMHDGLDLTVFGRGYPLRWPEGPFPAVTAAVPRMEFDARLLDAAIESGAVFRGGVRVLDVLTDESGRVSGVRTAEGDIGCRTLLVADGAGSPVGNRLGRKWLRDKMYAVAARSYMTSARGDEKMLTVAVGAGSGDAVMTPGYGWLFPLGDGRVNVGYGAMVSDELPLPGSSRSLHDAFIEQMRDRWQLVGEPESYAAAPLSIGGMVENIAGPNWMLIGDAACGTNPVTGEGIDFAMESARHAVELLDSDDYTRVWPQLLQSLYAAPLAAERKIIRAIGLHPRLGRQLVPLLMSHGWRGRFVLRSAANLVADGDNDAAARLFRLVGRVSKRSERPIFGYSDVQ